ncbi:MAG: porin family protein [Bacteroidota bacterium]
MKKLIFTVAAVCAFGFANAQDDSMSFGVKGGVNMASVDAEDTGSLISFHVGGFAEFMLTEKFAIQPELTYSGQGAKVEGFGGDYNLNLNYLNLPIMAKYFVTEDLSIELGPQIGFLMSAKADGEDAKDDFNTTDFGLNLGVGFNLNENMVLGLRYNMGLTELEKEVAAGAEGTKQSVLQVSFGYKF